jgi:hypothetical protein
MQLLWLPTLSIADSTHDVAPVPIFFLIETLLIYAAWR